MDSQYSEACSGAGPGRSGGIAPDESPGPVVADDDMDVDDEATGDPVDEVSSAAAPVEVPPPVLVASTEGADEDPQALPTRRRSAIADRMSAQAITGSPGPSLRWRAAA